MAGVSRLLKAYGGAYLAKHAGRMTPQQRKVLRVVMACREEQLGTIRYRCDGCGHEQTVPRSCCNRHCSACQWKQQTAWLEKQQRLLLPCPYFMLTFTLPSGLRDLAMRHSRVVYAALPSAAAYSLKRGAANPRFVGAKETGFFGVLHTWGRDLSYHPHVHFLVAGGGIGDDGTWQACSTKVFVPEQVLESLFQRKLKLLLEQAGLLAKVPAQVWDGRFVVNSKPVGSGEHALKYLAPYVSRGCVADWRVTAFDDPAKGDFESARLTLQVKRSGTQRYRPVPMRVEEFIRRWLLHVCPNGLHRVRHYGFLHSHSRRSTDELCLLIAVALGLSHYLAGSVADESESTGSRPMSCELCGDTMSPVAFLSPPQPPIRVPARAPP